MEYVIKVKANGYEETSLHVNAKNLKVAQSFERESLRKFAAHNDISFSDAKGFGFVSIIRK